MSEDWRRDLEAAGSTVEVIKPAEGGVGLSAASHEDVPRPEAPAPAHPLGGEPRWLCELGWPEKPPARRYLLERPLKDGEAVGFMPAGKVCMLMAAGGAGKTMVLLQLAVAVITGKSWLNYYSVPAKERGRVLVLLGEEDKEEAQRRLHSIRDGLGLRDDWALVEQGLDIRPLAGTDVRLVEGEGHNAKTTPGHDALQGLLAKGGYRLVILDPLSRFAGPETETDNHAATRFVTALEALVKASGATLMVSHHTTKEARKTNAGDATAARGASALTDGVRWALTMHHAPIGDDETELRLALSKTNYSAPAEPIALDRVTDGVLKMRPATHKPTKVSKTRGNGSANHGRHFSEAGEREWDDGN